MHDPKEVLEICEKATEGPWYGLEDAGVFADPEHEKPIFETGCGCCTRSDLKTEDADFTALARTALPQLVEDYRKLLAVAEAAEKLLQERPPCPHCDGFAHPKECICEPWDLLHGALTDAGYGGEE